MRHSCAYRIPSSVDLPICNLPHCHLPSVSVAQLLSVHIAGSDSSTPTCKECVHRNTQCLLANVTTPRTNWWPVVSTKSVEKTAIINASASVEFISGIVLCGAHTQTHRQTDRHTYIQRDRQTDTHTHTHTHRQTDRHTYTHTDRHTHTHRDRHTYKHTDRQTDTHTHTHTHTHTYNAALSRTTVHPYCTLRYLCGCWLELYSSVICLPYCNTS